MKRFCWVLNRHLDKIYACDLDTMNHERVTPTKPCFKGTAPEEAVRMIDKSKHPLLIIGSQALLNPDLDQKLADAVDKVNIPVYLTGMARGLLWAQRC
jgi:thiamine pyrophosphate-dependent acetolactate synthase large subunit-like protein